MKHNLIDASQLELEDKVVSIKRVTKVVKGGRNFRFSALVVVGADRSNVAARHASGWSLERIGDDAPRQMIVHDITRLIVLLSTFFIRYACGTSLRSICSGRSVSSHL